MMMAKPGGRRCWPALALLQTEPAQELEELSFLCKNGSQGSQDTQFLSVLFGQLEPVTHILFGPQSHCLVDLFRAFPALRSMALILGRMVDYSHQQRCIQTHRLSYSRVPKWWACWCPGRTPPPCPPLPRHGLCRKVHCWRKRQRSPSVAAQRTPHPASQPRQGLWCHGVPCPGASVTAHKTRGEQLSRQRRRGLGDSRGPDLQDRAPPPLPAWRGVSRRFRGRSAAGIAPRRPPWGVGQWFF